MNTTKTRPGASRTTCALIGTGALLAIAGDAGANVRWTVTFDDPSRVATSYQSQIAPNLLAAAEDWSQYFTDGRGSIDVLVRLSTSVSTASGRSVTSSFLYNNGSIDVWEQGAAAEIRRGVDPNGITPDVEIVIGQNFLQSSLWWDPQPTLRTTPVPGNLYDGYSVLLHEIGHAIAFNGWRNWYTGALGSYGSNFDELTSVVGSNFFFNGPTSMDIYGGPVPLTYRSIFHLGNGGIRPGNDLVSDVMNGVTFQRGHRYEISRLDLGVLADLGLPVEVPEAPAPTSVGVAVVALSLTLRRRRRA